MEVSQRDFPLPLPNELSISLTQGFSKSLHILCLSSPERAIWSKSKNKFELHTNFVSSKLIILTMQGQKCLVTFNNIITALTPL